VGMTPMGSSSPVRLPRPSVYYWRWALHLLGIGGVLLVAAGFVRSCLEGREAGRNAQCYGNLYQIGFALRNYHDRHGSLPPASLFDASGKPIHSWRALLLVDWHESGFHYRLDEPWNAPHNRTLWEDFQGSMLFSCPSDAATRAASITSITNYVAVVGEGTLWDASQADTLRDFRNLPSNKILLIELPGSHIRWLEPRDLTLEEALRLYAYPNGRVRSPHPRGLNYVSVGPEGEHARVLPPNIAADQLRAMLQVRATERSTR
jgi:hypothetical protein